MRRHTLGYTLIETLFVGSVAALLLALGAPSLGNMLRRSEMAATHNTLLAALATARIRALESGASGVLCPLTEEGLRCRTDGDWTHGWMVFVDHDNDGHLNGAEKPALVEQLSSTSGATIFSGRFRPTVRYARNGMSRGSNLTIRFCIDGTATSAIIINNAGRPRVERDASRLRGYSCVE